MKKEKLLEIGLTEEQADKVLEGFGAYVSKARFDEVNEQKKKALETIAERDKQLEDLQKSTSDSEGLKAEIAKLQEVNLLAQKQHEQELNALKIDTAVELALTNAGARNIKAVKALLNLENAELDGDNVKGLVEQINALKGGDDAFLFKVEEKPKTNNLPVGMKQTESNTSVNSKPQNEFDYNDWCNFLATNK